MTDRKPRKGPLVPSRDLAGATPETLALALLRPLGPRTVRQTGVRDEVAVEQTPADQPSHGVPHLRQRS